MRGEIKNNCKWGSTRKTYHQTESHEPTTVKTGVTLKRTYHSEDRRNSKVMNTSTMKGNLRNRIAIVEKKLLIRRKHRSK